MIQSSQGLWLLMPIQFFRTHNLSNAQGRDTGTWEQAKQQSPAARCCRRSIQNSSTVAGRKKTSRKTHPEGSKVATRGGEWEPDKISPKFETSAYVPKSPQALEPRSAKIAMDMLSRSRRPRLQRGSKASRNAELDCRDRSDRLHRPVRLGNQTPDRSDRLLRPVRPVAPRQPTNKASNVKSRANEVQIQQNLEENFVTTP